MNKEQILTLIAEMIGSNEVRGSQFILNVYFVESMIMGAGDFRHVITQTTRSGTGVPTGTVVQSVATRNEQLCQEVDQMMGVGELAAAAGAYLVAKASGKLAENIGGEVGNRIVKLWDAVRAKLAGKDALADFEKEPEDADAQGALRVQLKKALEADPAFREEVAKLVGELEAKGGRQAITQTATASGGSKIAQLAGKKNTVTM